jgi:DNA-binding HxlR family transcriptional regulator
LAATGDRWTLGIALALAPGRMRLAQLQRRLPGVSTGVLQRYLQQMVTLGLVTRTRFKEMPPRVELELTDAGRELLPVACMLARWGMRNLWSSPRSGEQIDIGTLLGLLPMLLEEQADLPEGLVEAIVTDAEPPLRRFYRVRDGRMHMKVGGDDADDLDTPSTIAAAAAVTVAMTARRSASIEGGGDAWIAALGPAHDCEQLHFTGDRQLAERILRALPRHG